MILFLMAEHGKALFQKLSEIRYPTINKYSPSSFDWVFDIEEAFTFLDWLCSCVQPSNLLTSVELKQYYNKFSYLVNKIFSNNLLIFCMCARFDCLEKDGFTVLEGKRLLEASNIPPMTPIMVGLEAELQELQKIKDNMLIQRQLYVNQLNICKYSYIILSPYQLVMCTT